MKESFWGYWLIALGVFIIVIMILIQNYTTTNTQDYYLLKEVTEASMIDAVDYGYYRTSGELRINEEKFVENFLRRFSETMNINKEYKIDFYSIYEQPPKVSVKISTSTGEYMVAADQTSFDVVNRIDAILEMKIGTDEYEEDYKIDEYVGEE